MVDCDFQQCNKNKKERKKMNKENHRATGYA